MHMRFPLHTLLSALAAALCLASPAAAQTTYTPEPRPFSPTGWWDSQLSATQKLDPNSAAIVADLRRQVATYGTGFNTGAYTAPIYTVPATQPRLPVILDNGNLSLKAILGAGIPIPAGATGSTGTDGSIVLWQPATDTYWELWRLARQADGFHASYGGVITNASKSTGVFSGGTGVAASGTALQGGIVRPGEFGSWLIPHVLRIGVPELAKGLIRAPANRTDGKIAGAPIAMGQRFRIDPSVNVFGLDIPNQTKILAYAAQRYGMIVADTSGAVSAYGEDPLAMPLDPWTALFGNVTTSGAMRAFPWDKLQALPPLS
jgi:hypothetical protein